MRYNYNRYNRDENERKVADKIANGERLNEKERAIAAKMNNYGYNPNNFGWGRRYKDI